MRLVLIVVFLGLLTTSEAYGLSPATLFEKQAEPENPAVSKIGSLCLYCVEEGVVQRLLFTQEELKTLSGIKINGYVWGIVAFCDPNVTASVQGRPLTRIAENQDKTYSIKYFGNVPFDELFAAPKHRGASNGNGLNRMNAYSLFPVVNGDAVVYGDEFLLSFQDGPGQFAISVQQNGYRVFKDLHPQDANKELKFKYLGGIPEGINVDPHDLQDRLSAIEKGVNDVESLFHMNLIDKVNIVKFNPAYGGVTVDNGAKSMWLYDKVFEYESSLEMMHMASHETLHQYVMAKGWTKYTQVRELFSDIKGYDPLSRERFLLITRGITPPEEFEAPEDNLFFAFLDERNFLKGARGGHSRQDLDEFCTSFFHSLMHVNRLRKNLFKKVHLREGSNDSGKFLTLSEKKLVLDFYGRTIQCFLDILSDGRPLNGAVSKDPAGRMLKQGLKVVHTLQAELAGKRKIIPS